MIQLKAENFGLQAKLDKAQLDFVSSNDNLVLQKKIASEKDAISDQYKLEAEKFQKQLENVQKISTVSIEKVNESWKNKFDDLVEEGIVFKGRTDDLENEVSDLKSQLIDFELIQKQVRHWRFILLFIQ